MVRSLQPGDRGGFLCIGVGDLGNSGGLMVGTDEQGVELVRYRVDSMAAAYCVRPDGKGGFIVGGSEWLEGRSDKCAVVGNLTPSVNLLRAADLR